jgi:hypothetical protein
VAAWLGAFLLLAQELPPNAWVEVKPRIAQPAAADEKGRWNNAGWNKLVYDAGGRRILFYDRWYDEKHGGYTIYGNSLLSFDPATAALAPLKIAHWQRVRDQHYRTVPLPENAKEPTPCDRHVYHAFELAPDLRAVFIANGANQAAVNGDVKGHDNCADTWRFDLESGKWTRLASKEHPRNDLEDGMAYSPETKSIVYAGHGKLWILDVASGQWRRAKSQLPRSHMGMTVFHDPPRKSMLLVGGGSYDKWQTKAGGFNKVYAFDPVTEALSELSESPTAWCRGALAYDSKRDLFFGVNHFKGEGVEQPGGMFAYDPKKDAWRAVKQEKEIAFQRTTWLPICYDAANDRLWAIHGESFWTFRVAD